MGLPAKKRVASTNFVSIGVAANGDCVRADVSLYKLHDTIQLIKNNREACFNFGIDTLPDKFYF